MANSNYTEATDMKHKVIWRKEVEGVELPVAGIELKVEDEGGD